MYHFPSSAGTERNFADVTIRNLITGTDHPLSLAFASLTGTHPQSMSKLSDRAYYIVDGGAKFDVGPDSFEVGPGDAVYVPKRTHHAMTGNIRYVVVNTPPYDPAAEDTADS